MRNLIHPMSGLVSLLAVSACGGAEPEPVSPPPPPPPAETAEPPEPAPAEPPPAAEAPKPPTPEQVAKFYQDCWAMWASKSADFVTKCYSETAVRESPDSGMPPLIGRQAIAAYDKAFDGALPDRTGELQLVLVNGKNVAGIALFKGTHTGPLKGPAGEMPATGKKVGLLFGHLIETDDAGLASHEWGFLENGTFMAQLGVNPSPARPVMETGWATRPVVLARNDETEKKNVEAFNKSIEDFNKHDGKQIGAGMTDDVVWHEMAMPKDMKKKEAVDNLTGLFKAFSDLKITPTSVWGAGDYVVATGKIAGTNDGDMKAMKLKKTGKKVDMSWLEIDRFKDGKLAEGWLFYDGMAFANQLGLVPPPGAKDKGGAKK